MASWQTIPVGLRCYQPRSGAVSIERLQNWYAEPNKGNPEQPVTLYPTPGLKLWSTIGEGPIRGIYAFGSDLYVVSGTTLYIVDRTTKTATEMGEITSAGAVRMIDNGTHVAIATAVNLYAANRSGILALPEQYMSGVAYQDGYVIFSQRGNEKFFLSGIDDLTTIDPLDFSSADAFADNLVTCLSDHRELILFGEKTTEFWSNTGDASFPFQRIPGGFIEHGCASAGSVAKTENMVFWLGDNLTVYAAQGYSPQAISTTDIERMIADAGGAGGAEAFTYSQAGHTFYVLNFADLTLAYDITTGIWHERKSYGIGRWRANSYANLARTHLVGDYEDGRVYELDIDTFSDDSGVAIERESIFPALGDGVSNVSFHELRVLMEQGVGTTSGQGSAPVAMLDWSDDDGDTFGTEIRASIGAQGNRTQRTSFNRLGTSRRRHFRLRVTDPVKAVVLGVKARMEVAA